MVNVSQGLVFHANQTVAHSGMKLVPLVGKQEQALSAAVYIKGQTWKGSKLTAQTYQSFKEPS